LKKGGYYMDKNIIFIFGKGFVFSIIFTIMALIILSAILSFSNISEDIISPTIIGISSGSILIASFLIARKIKEKGIINGLILGSIYMATLYLISSILGGNFSLNISSFIMLGIGVFSGMIGGIIGVNFYKNS
jgi:putative membrane protein (TIGR04086 family)